jgi:NAD-dependent SIR2 family protein deacetylase
MCEEGMSRTIFILGAGASAAAGAPVMGTLMNSAIELSRSGSLEGDDKAAFELVFRARTQLQSVFSKATLNINNIESLFGAFEMAGLLGQLGELGTEDLEKLPESIIRVIARTIEKAVEYQVTGGMEFPRMNPPQPYEQFCELLSALRKKERLTDGVAVITFNYDVALDYALQFSGILCDYCLEDRAGLGLHLLKLHGSLNWARCSQCRQVIPVDMGQLTARLRPSHGAKRVHIEVTRMLHSESHCSFPLEDKPELVPPTWNKGKYHKELSNVWRAAATHLSQAENVFIIGYSFPETDEFFRYFYALGAVGPTILRNVWIVNLDPAVTDRFGKVLAAHALAPECFRFVNSTFADAIPTIGEKLGVMA